MQEATRPDPEKKPMSRLALALAGLLSLGALAQEGARTADGEGRRVAERYEDEVRQRAGELANTPVNVAPPAPVDDRVPPSDSSFARGRLKNCETKPLHESRLPLCSELEAKQREEEAARRRAEEDARRKAEAAGGPNGNGGGGNGGSGDESPPGKPPRDYSQYSCWNAPVDCMAVTGAWGDKPVEREKRLYRIQLRNVCERRVYARFCLERAGQKPWCTVDGFQPGQSRSFSANNATGQYRVKYIGVEKGGHDLICPRPAGWREMGEL